MTLYEKILDALGQIVLPASTGDIHKRMVKLGYYPGVDPIIERRGLSARLAEMRSKGVLYSRQHPTHATLYWNTEDYRIEDYLPIDSAPIVRPPQQFAPVEEPAQKIAEKPRITTKELESAMEMKIITDSMNDIIKSLLTIKVTLEKSSWAK